MVLKTILLRGGVPYQPAHNVSRFEEVIATKPFEKDLKDSIELILLSAQDFETAIGRFGQWTVFDCSRDAWVREVRSGCGGRQGRGDHPQGKETLTHMIWDMGL